MVNPSPQNHNPGPCHAAVRWCASSLNAPAVLPRKCLKGGKGTLGVGRPLGCNYIIWDVAARGGFSYRAAVLLWTQGEQGRTI